MRINWQKRSSLRTSHLEPMALLVAYVKHAGSGPNKTLSRVMFLSPRASACTGSTRDFEYYIRTVAHASPVLPRRDAASHEFRWDLTVSPFDYSKNFVGVSIPILVACVWVICFSKVVYEGLCTSCHEGTVLSSKLCENRTGKSEGPCAAS